MDFPKINIRGVDFANVTPDEAAEIAKNFIAGNKPRAIYTPNAEIVQACIDEKTGGFYDIINSADMVIPDGSGVVLASKILKTPLKQKVGGFDLTRNRIIPYLNEIGGTLFLLGATEENVIKAAENLSAEYKNLKIFYNDGYFNKENEENDAVIKKINGCSPDVIIVCLGALGLKQEKWIFDNKNKLDARLLLGLGGTIDIIAGAKKYAPKIFIKLHLEWLYYYIRHPSRLKRFKELPKFIFGTMFTKKNKKIKTEGDKK